MPICTYYTPSGNEDELIPADIKELIVEIREECGLTLKDFMVTGPFVHYTGWNWRTLFGDKDGRRYNVIVHIASVEYQVVNVGTADCGIYTNLTVSELRAFLVGLRIAIGSKRFREAS